MKRPAHEGSKLLSASVQLENPPPGVLVFIMDKRQFGLTPLKKALLAVRRVSFTMQLDLRAS